MGKLLIFIVLLSTSSYLQAQDYSFPIGKSKTEIREANKKIPFVISAQGDTVDNYSTANQQMIYYYKNNICFRVKEVFPLDQEFIIQATFDKVYKKIKDNKWIDPKNNQIDLTENKENKQFSFDVYANTAN